ncbi:Flavin-containing monooxygenase FMO GS-OX-like 2 [Hondaea fermentalgiana]|uniref:Flavin-containing monooxygenase FMO GS-OX-like 2 n=1 Tax=Hondaea fermentalgiana TaxID=2315210 RepID=A0A2R5G7Z7_9STRA|nr:Flavin-containing monooxygenase FMO GS-OX-like 2 [Hondaea fermentalgiana]|eukprot:GBG24613.1 Flavin-containing monooxygenase FMO GS-OX-like 2 [Hondaea fermentalgiana]
MFNQHRKDARSAPVEAKPGQVEDLSRCEVLLGKSRGKTFLRGINNGVIYPNNYMRHVALGNIIVKQGLVDGLTPSGVQLESGETYDADTVLACFGAGKIYFPMLPQKYREIMEAHKLGVQLYRHTIHPDIPNVVFHGFNAGFMMIVTNEIAALWNVARLWGVLELPPREEMLDEMERIAAWKDANNSPSQPHYFAIGSRCIYLLDKMMHEMGLNRFRKMPNLYAEIFTSYKDRDYKDAQAEFLQKYVSRKPTSLTAVTPASPTSKKEL